MAVTPRGQIADALGAATGAYAPPPPPPTPTAMPRRLVTGLTSRSRARTNDKVLALLKAGKGGGQVLEANWRDMQPTSSTGLAESWVLSIVADLDWANGHGLGVLLRIFCGAYAPTFVKTAVGTMTWYTNDGSLGTGPGAPSDASWKQIVGGIPCWWKSPYASAYASLVVALAAEPRIVGHPALCGVTMSGPMTQYAEPMVKQFALVENRQSAVAAGYTQAADEAAYAAGFNAHKASLSPLGVATYCAFNDYQFITAAGGIKVDAAITVRIMEQYVATLGRLGVIENNSLQYPTTKYPTMYARMRAFRTQTPPSALHFQTETLPKHEALWDSQPAGAKLTSPKATADLALSWGASAVEMPTGWENPSMAGSVERWPAVTVAEATVLNQRAYDNTVGLTADVPASAPAPEPLTVSAPSGSPAKTTASDSTGVLATLTTGAKTVLMRGPSRTFVEDKKPFKDDFARTTTGGFGKSPGGGNYSNTTGADAIFTVSGGLGRIALDVANSSRYTTMVNDAADVNVVTRWTMDEIPVGNAASLGLVIGYADPNNNYRARLSISTAGVVQLTLEKEVAGVTTALGALTQVGTGWVANQYWLIRIQRTGTTIRCRAWLDGTTEPTAWLHSVTDSDLGAGRIGLRALASSGNTNVPFTYLIDYIDVQSCTWPAPISITHNSWVRVLSDPYSGTWTPAVEAQVRAWAGDTSPDALAYARLYQTGAPVVLDSSGNRVSGEAGYGPFNSDGTVQEGADFHEYMGVGWSFASGETAPNAGASWIGKLDCSGFVRMVYGYWLGIPLSVSTTGSGYLPRVSNVMSDSGPGVLVASASGAVPDMTNLQIGDVVAFDADSGDVISGQIDHVGIYMGTDSLGVPRFVSARKTPNGPTFADLGGSSALTGSGLYATRLRKIRRF